MGAVSVGGREEKFLFLSRQEEKEGKKDRKLELEPFKRGGFSSLFLFFGLHALECGSCRCWSEGIHPIPPLKTFWAAVGRGE